MQTIHKGQLANKLRKCRAETCKLLKVVMSSIFGMVSGLESSGKSRENLLLLRLAAAFGETLERQMQKPGNVSRVNKVRESQTDPVPVRHGEAAYCCMFFARGCCALGRECTFLHRCLAHAAIFNPRYPIEPGMNLPECPRRRTKSGWTCSTTSLAASATRRTATTCAASVRPGRAAAPLFCVYSMNPSPPSS